MLFVDIILRFKKNFCKCIFLFTGTLFPRCTCAAIFSIAIKFAFGSIVSELLFRINFAIQKTISMKILVLCVINSSRHRKCFVWGFIHSFFVSKTLTRSYLARSGF